MPPMAGLLSKYRNLSCHVASLPSELDAWKDRASAGDTLEKNYRQILALDYFMRRLCALNEDIVNVLDPAGDVDDFLSNARSLSANLVKSHAIWDFFRDRLELRFVPQFQQSLLMADIVSYDCFSAVMDRAKALEIVPEHSFREYPLIGLHNKLLPITLRRGRRPEALQNHNLPIPVIDMPWDHLATPWNLLTIAHEVGHDVDEDLGRLHRELERAVAHQLSESSVPGSRIVQWQKWTSEILADVVAVLLAGVAFVNVLAGFLTLPRREVRLILYADEHPPHYLRVLINTELVRRVGLSQIAAQLEADWKSLYGEPENEFGPLLPDIELVISTMLDTPLENLCERSLGEFIAFTPSDQGLIQEAAAKLSSDAPLDGLPVRHIVSASQLAFEKMARRGSTSGFEKLAQHTCQAIIDISPSGQLDAQLPRRFRDYLDDLAGSTLDRPLDDFGIELRT